MMILKMSSAKGDHFVLASIYLFTLREWITWKIILLWFNMLYTSQNIMPHHCMCIILVFGIRYGLNKSGKTPSPWANGGPRAPPMILREWYHFVQGTLRNHISDVTRKKLGLTTNFSHFSKWLPQNLIFPISRKLLHVGSWFWGLNLYFLGQGIR